MFTWNHRLFVETLKDGSKWYSVREVHYEKDGSIIAYSMRPERIDGESKRDIRKMLEWMLKCLDDPILDKSKIKFNRNPRKDGGE